jgi:hypothetical protein
MRTEVTRKKIGRRKGKLEGKEHPHAPAVHQDLPDNYGEDLVSLIVVAPRRIFALWEVAGKKKLPRLAVRLYDITESTLQGRPVWQEVEAGKSGKCYFEAESGHEYVAEAGTMLLSGRFRMLLQSEIVRTPSISSKLLFISAPCEHEERAGYECNKK